jgi:hypothetical protein
MYMLTVALGVGVAGFSIPALFAPPGAEDDPLSGTYEFAAPILDITATTDGSILVAMTPHTVKEIRQDSVETIATIPVEDGALVNGLGGTGEGEYIIATGGLDQGVGAALWRIAGANIERISDIYSYEREHDPDALEGSKWKHPACEEDSVQGFTTGPQSNPYHLARLHSGSVLIADAAGNTLLESDVDGNVDWIAIFEPPLNNEGAWGFFKQAEGNVEIQCYIQPVPTAVAVDPQGAYYVGELTGMPAATGWSRVWRIAPGRRHVVCPSEDCEEVLSDLTSVVDVEFGPDGRFYVVELDRNGWLAALTGNPGGGRVHRCDLESGKCDVVYESNMAVPAITFDRWDQMWVAENEVLMGEGGAVVHRVTME